MKEEASLFVVYVLVKVPVWCLNWQKTVGGTCRRSTKILVPMRASAYVPQEKMAVMYRYSAKVSTVHFELLIRVGTMERSHTRVTFQMVSECSMDGILESFRSGVLYLKSI
jgi:hypothetical protein